MTRRVLGPIPSVPAGTRSARGTGAKAPNPTHVNASSPMGHNVTPGLVPTSSTPNTWYKDYSAGETDFAVMKA